MRPTSDLEEKLKYLDTLLIPETDKTKPPAEFPPLSSMMTLLTASKLMKEKNLMNLLLPVIVSLKHR